MCRGVCGYKDAGSPGALLAPPGGTRRGSFGTPDRIVSLRYALGAQKVVPGTLQGASGVPPGSPLGASGEPPGGLREPPGCLRGASGEKGRGGRELVDDLRFMREPPNHISSFISPICP